MAEADAIGDPSLLRDGLADRDRIAKPTGRPFRAGLDPRGTSMPSGKSWR
jgi:hypothetical protein